MRAENRHYTAKWKKKRKNHGADRCNNAKCTICHSAKVLGLPSRQEMRATYGSASTGHQKISSETAHLLNP